jgi:hypothetical protein
MVFLRKIRPRRLDYGVAALLLLTLFVGCNSQPKAPALEDGPVFYDRQQGIRFLVPPRWTQSVHAVVPPGRLDAERIIVEYKLPTAKAASFEVSCVDLDKGAKLDDYVAAHVPGAANWKLTKPGQPCQINGVDAERMTLIGYPRLPDPFTREVVAFRRADRVYFFTGIFASSDKRAAEQIHQAVESVIWS